MNIVLAAFSSYMCAEKAAETTFVQQMRAYNVDEIDSWGQFYQPFGTWYIFCVVQFHQLVSKHNKMVGTTFTIYALCHLESL